MHTSVQLSRSMKALRARLDYVNRTWPVGNAESLLGFYVHIIPKLLDAERCAVFIRDPASGAIVSKAGTGLDGAEIAAPREGSIVGEVISSGRHVVRNALVGTPGFHQTSDAQTGFVTRNLLCVPVCEVNGARTTGAVEVLNKRDPGGFTEEDRALVEEVAGNLSMALDNILLSSEIVRLSDELSREASRFQSDYLGEVPFVAESAAMRAVMELVRMVSGTPVNVLIQGENGTGKEVMARMIHEGREQRETPFVAVNCAAIPEHLMESEFFGYEKGAFTGAVTSRAGRFEEASGGTLFLDEVADMPFTIQPKFLRAVQEGEGTRLGSNRVSAYDVKLISACNRDLRAAVADGLFREDLFYRLFAVEIVVPPLRERRDDIAPLTFAFVDDVCRRFDKVPAGTSQELISLFESYAWPGNVRQLRREVERLVALTPEGQPLTPERCSAEVRSGVATLGVGGDDDYSLPERVRQLEVQLIHRALEKTGGRKGEAAALLHITRQGLHKKLKRYAIG